MNVFLFILTVLIWGTTWIAIAMQMGPVPVLVSVFYRFALAAVVMLFGLIVLRRLTLPRLKDQPFLLLQAACLFCFNFICLYSAAAYIPSGLVSVIFSLASIFNAINARIFFGDRIAGRVLLAGALGASGLFLLLGDDILVHINLNVLKGVGFAALGTVFFSLGNMASRRNTAAAVPVTIANAWGMVYGSAFLLVLVFMTSTPLVAPPEGTYIAALIYLAVIGSIVGFTAYLLLVARIGSAKAGYATVLFPVVALTASTLFEGYKWHWLGILGLGLTILGNIVMFARPSARPRPEARTAPDGEARRQSQIGTAGSSPNSRTPTR